jgi:type IV secretory pathway TrbD component
VSVAARSWLWAEAFRVERRGMDARAGLAGAVSSCAPLALGVAAGEPEIGVTACFGGLNAALAVPRGGLPERVGWGSGAALASCLSVAIATAVQDSVAASVAAAFAVVGLAAFLRAFGPDGALAGFVVGAIFVITNGLPAGALDVGERVLWFAAGSATGVVLMTLAYAGARSSARPEPQFGDPLLRAHALRLASIVAATTLAYQLLDLEHGYWVPLTILAVLQPDEHASDVRAVQRAAGTLGGTALMALIAVITGAEWVMVACQGLAAFGLFALFARGYFWLVVLLTPTALLTVSAVDYQGVGVALQRAGWSALGILVGLAVAELWWRLAPHVPARRAPAPAAPG